VVGQKLTGVEDSLGKAIDKLVENKKSASSPSSPPSQPQEIYLKAIPLRNFEDIDIIKAEVKAGNIVITNVSPLAKKNMDDVKRAVNILSEYMSTIEGDIARLGEERIVLTPKNVKIWRGEAEKEPS
jgi:SepF-like predicted cell division protein (DUF552 family)